MAGRGAGQLKDLQDRVGAVEGRLDRVETTLEFSEAYRRVRIEHSRGLADLSTRIDSREIPANRIKDEASRIIDEEVKAQLSKQVVAKTSAGKKSRTQQGEKKPSGTRCALKGGVGVHPTTL